MEHIVAALDLDGTLFRDQVVHQVAEEFGLDLPRNFYLKDWPEEARKNAGRMFLDVGIMGNLKPNVGAVEFVEMLIENGVECIAVTGRPDTIHRATTDMVKRHFKGIETVISLGGFNKGDTYSDIGASIVIDDNADHIYQAIDVGTKLPILFSNSDTPYNHSEVRGVCSKGGIVASDFNRLLSCFQMWPWKEVSCGDNRDFGKGV